MRTLDEILRLLNKDSETKVYDVVNVDVELFSDEFKKKLSVQEPLLSTTVTIDYRETLFPNCWKYYLYLKDALEECQMNYKKNPEDVRKLYLAVRLWGQVFNTYNKESYWEYDETLHQQYLAITSFIDCVEDFYDFLNSPERQQKAKEINENLRNLSRNMMTMEFDTGATGTSQTKGENDMKKKDQKDLLIFVRGIIDEVINGIDVNDRNGKELYSLAEQTKEQIEEGMSSIEEFGRVYEELYKNLKEDYLIRTNADKLKSILLDTYTKKNADYGNSFAESVAWFGYEAAFVRIYDKVMRYMSLEKKDPQVVSESKADTLMDLANYCVMLYSILDDKPYDESLDYIIEQFKDNSFAVQDTILYSGNEPIMRTPSHYYIPTDQWKASLEVWDDDMPELQDEVFKLAISAIRIIIFGEVEIDGGN